MKNWTFGTQLAVGLGILLAGNILAMLTHQEILANIGGVLYGLLFVVHPVWPASAAANPRTLRRVSRICGLLLILWSVLAGYSL